MARDDGGGRRSPEEIEYEEIQRQARISEPTEGGIREEDRVNAGLELQADDRMKESDLRREQFRRAHEARAEAAQASGEAAALTPSILDSVEPPDARARLAEQFGGGEAGRSMRKPTAAPSRVLLRIAGLGLAFGAAFLLWQGLQGRGSQEQVRPPAIATPAPATPAQVIVTPAPATAAPATPAPATPAQATPSAAPSGIAPTARPTVQTTAAPVGGFVCGLPGGPTCPPRP